MVMGGLESSELHVVSLNNDPNLETLADLLNANGHTTLLLQPEEGLVDLVEMVRQAYPGGDLSALHLYGHGMAGSQQLGRDTISQATINDQNELWEELGQLTTDDSDLLLYGCNTGNGRDGTIIADALAEVSGMDVAASDDITGSPSSLNDADWDLEVQTGSINTSVASITSQWVGELKLEWYDPDNYPYKIAPLRWTEDPQDPELERAKLTVPLDYDRPNGQTATIAMGRIKATGRNPIGSLFFNPGGPGGSGLNSLRSTYNDLPEAVRQQFHLVSFDPRGIGASTPTLEVKNAPFPIPPDQGSTDWTTTLDQSRDNFRTINTQTQADNQSFINHLGTKNVARDLELMRRAVGDNKLNFLGFSYGTRIGYTYATMFPENIRTLILDGNINPNGDYADLTSSAIGPDIALDLVREKSPSVVEAFDIGFHIIKDSPIPLEENLNFNLNDYIEVATGQLSLGPQFIDRIKSLSKFVVDAASGSAEAEEAKTTLKRIKPTKNTNAGGMFAVVNLLDYADRPTEQQQYRNVEAAMSEGPLAGPLAVNYSAGGAGFELESEPVPDMSLQRLKNKVAKIPVLISNATADAMTPRFWAIPMTEAFASHSFLEQTSTQHCISLNPDHCIRKAVETYLIKGKLPQSEICPWPEASED